MGLVSVSLFLVGSRAQIPLGSTLNMKMNKTNRIIDVFNEMSQIIRCVLLFNIIDGIRVILSTEDQFFGFATPEDRNGNI